MSNIVLNSDQEENKTQINRKIDLYGMCLETSRTGAGKTPICCRVIYERAIKYGIVICENDLQCEHWLKHKERYNINIVLIITYDNLRGNKKLIFYDGLPTLQHYLLHKVNGVYYPTNFFKAMVEEGVALIADECHSLKNRCGKTMAFKALSSYITYRNSYQLTGIKSFSYFISMTPFDKPEHAIQLAITSGIIPCDNLYDNNTKTPYGLQYLYEYCKRFDQITTQKIWGMYDITDKNCNEVAYKLITEVFLRKISSFTKNVNCGYTFKQTIYYAYFTVHNEAHRLMKRALRMIKSNKNKNKNKDVDMEKLMQYFSNYNDPNSVTLIEDIEREEISNNQIIEQNSQIIDQINQEEEYDNRLFSSIVNKPGNLLKERDGVIQGTITIQSIKTYFIILGFVQQIFQQIPNSKIVIFLNYKESINIAMRFLQAYNPVKITGDSDCPKEKRKAIISKFNEPNLDSRLLIIIAQIGSDSVEFDDKHGGFPRVAMGFPDFYFSRYFQPPGRFHRINTMSNTLYFFLLVYSEEYSEESVQKSLIEKSKTMQETLQDNEIIPPSNYLSIKDPHLHGLMNLLENAGMNLLQKPIQMLQNSTPQRITMPSIMKKF